MFIDGVLYALAQAYAYSRDHLHIIAALSFSAGVRSGIHTLKHKNRKFPVMVEAYIEYCDPDFLTTTALQEGQPPIDVSIIRAQAPYSCFMANMATVEPSIRSKTNATTDVGEIWKAAIVRYEKMTTVKIESLVVVDNVDGILDEIRGRETKFKGYRHDGSKLDKFRSLVSKSLDPIEKLSSIVATATSTVRQKLPSAY